MIEAQFDGLPGPTHHFGGLAFGNKASIAHEGQISHPRAAALQCLRKMNLLRQLGVPQAILPPQERPHLPTLRALGFSGSDIEILSHAGNLLLPCSSSASMWAANAATVTPSSDADDKKVHFTPANLNTHFHRSIEASFTSLLLKRLFNDSEYFVHHSPLPYFPDEGAANHTRFDKGNGQGVHLFVYGASHFNKLQAPQKYPARQFLEASQAIARLHRLDSQTVIYAQQNPEAVDAGVFHNDVASVGHKTLFFCHERAFVDQNTIIDNLSEVVHRNLHSPLKLILVKESEVSLEEAVRTYLFNSQLVTKKDNTSALVAPLECQRSPTVSSYLNTLDRSLIQEIHYVDLFESMANGGGPACLRLRVPLTAKEWNAVHPGVWLNDTLSNKLEEWINHFYREEISLKDLADPRLLQESQQALAYLSEILVLPDLYSFQREK